MFYHIKDLQFNLMRPDPAFVKLLLEQFGGSNGELAVAMCYFVQAFGGYQVLLFPVNKLIYDLR